MTGSLLSKTVSIHALSPQSHNCTSKDTITGGFLWIYFLKDYSIASFHASMRSQMFYKIDIPENSAKFTGNQLYQTLLTSAQIFFENFLKFLGTPFLQNTSGWFWIWQGFEQTRVLNNPGFWIYQGSEYAPGYEFARVLNTRLVVNLPGFWICQDYTGFWICLNMPDYVWLNMPGCVWICWDMREYA